MSNNILDEANEKLANEKLNLGNLISYYTNVTDDDNVERNYEIMRLDILPKYREYLFDNVDTIKFQSIFKYRPEYVSYELYGTSSYDYLVMYANNISDKKKFTLDKMTNGYIKYFKKEAIDEIISEISSNSKNASQSVNVENYLLYSI